MEINRENRNLISIVIFLILIRCPPTTGSSSGRRHFVLVHGAGHGAWCWYKIIEGLKSDGHNVTAIDLAASGIDLRRADSLRSISEYFQPLMEFMESLDEADKVDLVGHSLGGLAISKAMEVFPCKVHVAVFVTALMPGPTLSITSINIELGKWQAPMLDNRFIYGDGADNPPTLFVAGPIYLSSIMYNRSPVKDVELAKMLVRPMRLFTEADMEKEFVLTEGNYGSVKRIFVVVEDDRVLGSGFQRWMIEKNPPDQVGSIKMSDHMVMISKAIHLLDHLQVISSSYT